MVLRGSWYYLQVIAICQSFPSPATLSIKTRKKHVLFYIEEQVVYEIIIQTRQDCPMGNTKQILYFFKNCT